MESGTKLLVFVLGLAAILLKASADVGSVLTRPLFEQMIPPQNDAACPFRTFYTYDAFLAGAQAFPAFGTSGDLTTQNRELAAFFGQTSHETRGGSNSAPEGYCFVKEQSNSQGNNYYGRGPIQLTGQSNYDDAGKAIQEDLVSNPDLVATDPVISFKTAIWFWMTAQGNKPSCHDVITNTWKPTAADTSAGRVPGYGVITNIINGGLECGQGPNDQVADRIGFYKTYCDLLQVSYGDNLDCYNQMHF